MIVVEGPDGAGKTTLIKELASRFSLPVAARVVSKDAEAMVDLKQWTEDNINRGFHLTLYDRHRLISEPIYGSILRAEFEPGFDDLIWLATLNFQFYNFCRPIIVYCLPPFYEVTSNISEDPDNRVVWNHIRSIYSLYLAKAAMDIAHSPINTFTYDYTEPSSLENLMARLEERLCHG